ncbi:sporulation protein YunB [Bacillus horti]|uniref:Sporulation protein YunB n=1 Tax=Caldalkalibacillus horti TaxID=77523 RepID=A0ABT9W4Q7_9BACI|nr:sporulation protein YunB [Bacillus horti]MDQ0168234.1 sporulation protein YunB [Bacillus horti]
MSKGFRPATQRSFLKKRHIFLIVLVIILIISIQGFLFVERNLEPALKNIAATHVKQIATLTISDAISHKLSQDIGSNEVVIFEKDEDGKIILITFDQAKQAEIVSTVIDRANEELRELSNSPIRIPLGQALNSNILAQLGPLVPITLVPMGAAKADISIEMEEAGINVVSITVYLKIQADVRIVIPFSSDEAVVSTSLPIDFIVLPGEVPNVYVKNSDGSVTPVPLAIPTDDLVDTP